ncbi:hypothetical protein MYK68_04105 [Gordonia sp. PP30]|uniref:DUF6414 family protein n=1 Tax=Gordonia sp. PP30 TaxID=2935861 RepID=UPI00200059C5|nr:hypothetical protein [Gordonia sp. PP30]UQE75803.1 hypothetical protein MYK68_04105 [Gordonia sp. PP30]
MAFRRFLYLDDSIVSAYLGSFEDGARESIAREQASEGKFDARLGIGPVSAGVGKGRTTRETHSIVDTPEARYERLSTLGRDTPNEWSVEFEPAGLGQLPIGHIVELSVDIYVPEMVKMLQRDGDVVQALDLMASFEPMAETLGLDTIGLPDRTERDSVRQALASMPDTDLMVVGEFEDATWKVAGKVERQHLRSADLDGDVVVVGKVIKRWADDEWLPILALPGMNLLPRDQRRQMAREVPKDGDASSIKGPGLTLDIIAIYR